MPRPHLLYTPTDGIFKSPPGAEVGVREGMVGERASELGRGQRARPHRTVKIRYLKSNEKLETGLPVENKGREKELEETQEEH